jgi:ribosomal protein S12 methylthiotransferase
MRGKHVTKPIEEVVREANELAADGVRELIVVAQDTTSYGLDLYGRTRLADLVRELDRVDGIEWVRTLYAYPEHISDELIDTFAGAKKVIPYLDMPLQHISDRVLKRMIRRVDRAATEALLGRLRARWPDLAIRTTFIAGFPGETDAEFEELKRFVAEFKFERVGVFPYSREPGTPAEKLDGHLPEDVKRARVAAIMEVQQGVAFGWAAAQVGKEHPVLIDGPDPEFASHFRGRTYADAPEIDCAVRVKGKNLQAGDFVRAKVSAAGSGRPQPLNTSPGRGADATHPATHLTIVRLITRSSIQAAPRVGNRRSRRGAGRSGTGFALHLPATHRRCVPPPSPAPPAYQ